MSLRNLRGLALLMGLMFACVGIEPVLAQTAQSIVAQNDKDNDKTLDLAEVKAAASARFDKLDKDADGTVDSKEVKGLIGEKTFKRADPDNDGTLSKDEYLALVQKLFERADTDHDGTLTAKELRTPAARTLRKLID
jgi:hypothetical protein